MSRLEGVLVVLAALGLAPAATPAVRINPPQKPLDLSFMGFGVFQTDLDARQEGFFDSSDELPSEFTNRQLLNLRLEGTLTSAIKLDARVHFDRENLRDWRYLMRLSGERNELAFGELDGAFRDTFFTRFDTPFYGAEANIGLGALTTSAFATTRAGNYRVERLRGTNLSGPYILNASPVLEGSERIAVEVRERRDEEQLVSSDFQRPGLDYSIDYATGTILFTAPIASETFSGDPVFVLVEYQFELPGGSDAQYLTGARLAFEPTRGVKLGTTYLRSSGDQPSALNSRGIIGFDQHLELGDKVTFHNEMAGPGGSFLDRREGAWHVDAALRPYRDLELKLRYRRVGRDFETTANPTLDTDLDRQTLDLSLAWLPVPEHSFSAGFNRKADNVAADPAVDTTRTRTFFAGWEGRMEGWPLLRVDLERRLSDGPGSFGSGASKLDTFTFELEDELGRWPGLGATSLRSQYRYELADESPGERHAHYLSARLDSHPLVPLETYVELRASRTLSDELSLAEASSRELLLGGRYRIDRMLSVAASLRWRGDHSADPEIGDSTRTTAPFDLSFEPSERLRGALKYEWTLAESGSDTGRARTRNIYGFVVYRPWDGFDLSGGYQLDDQSDQFGGRDGSLNGEYFLTLLWKHERLTLFGRAERGRSSERLPPYDPTDSRRTTWLSGASYDLTDAWRVLAQLKDERLSGAIEAHRRAVVLELSRQLSRFLRLAAGTELTVDEQGDVDRLQRERVYLKAIWNV